jgi:hypothetical protein
MGNTFFPKVTTSPRTEWRKQAARHVLLYYEDAILAGLNLSPSFGLGSDRSNAAVLTLNRFVPLRTYF